MVNRGPYGHLQQVTFSLSVRDVTQLDKEAAERGVGRGILIREIMEVWLEADTEADDGG